MPAPDPQPLDDETRFVLAVQGGDLSAFAPLLDLHLDAIHALISVRLPVPHLVDELTHETFVTAFRQIHRFTAGTSFRAWLRAIAGNRIRAELERYAREHANRLKYTELQELDTALSLTDEQAELQVRHLDECLKALPANLSELIALKYRDEQSSDEIAVLLKRSAAWVRTTLFRVRQQLKECMEAKVNASPS